MVKWTALFVYIDFGLLPTYISDAILPIFRKMFVVQLKYQDSYPA